MAPKLGLAILVTYVFSLALIPITTNCMMAPKHYVRKRDSSGDEDLRKELEARASLFSLDRYESDPVFTQQVDTVNEKSVYKDPQTEQNYYERSASDKNKVAVVLKAEEDKVPIVGEKRFYIVLRMNNATDKPKKYFASIAYLVDPEPGHTTEDFIEFKGNKYAVEWDVWNDGTLEGFKYSFQFAVCRYSVLIPCKPELPGMRPESSNDKNVDPVKDKAETPKPEKITVSVGFPQNAYQSFFRDLDNNQISGRFQVVGMAFDFLGGVVDGVGALWCGLSGLVLGQCHQYDAESGYTKSQIGSPIVRSDGKVLAAGASEAFGSDGILGTVLNTVFTGNKAVPQAMMNTPPPDVVLGTQANYETVYVNGPPTPNRYGRKKRESGGPRLRGWRTQYAKTIEPNIIFNKDKDIFYGLGHCPASQKTSLELFDAAHSDEEIGKFYIDFLRNGCYTRVKNVIPALKTSGVLEIKGKRLYFVPGNILQAQTKLNWIEEQKLASALELYAISETFDSSRLNPDPNPKSAIDRKITNSMKFLEKFSLTFISTARTKCTKHYIRLLRHLVQILRSAFGAVREDGQNLDECKGDCSKDKEIVENDKFALMSIIKFVTHGLPYKAEPVYDHYKQFATLNQGVIEGAVKETL